MVTSPLIKTREKQKYKHGEKQCNIQLLCIVYVSIRQYYNNHITVVVIIRFKTRVKREYKPGGKTGYILHFAQW